jgi:cytochrome c556
VKTRALAAIWDEPAEFRAAAANLNGATKRLRAAAAGKDIGRVRAALGATGGACKACHDTYRVPD